MKLILTAFVTLIAVFAMADIPRPHVEPGPVSKIDAESLNALVYGASAAKLADLKAGSSTIVVQAQHLNPNTTRFIFTSRMCPAMGRCLENKQMSVDKNAVIGNDGKRVTYQASPVTKLR